ncbi:MAG TPA: alpha/beta hydrolase [Flavobacteriales bacterium]|nr:alpha/beta hydrolase [Flavobacteriales bacterium]
MKCIVFLLTVVPLSIYGQFGPKGAYFKNKNAVIYYEIYGTGDPVLVMNGGPGFSSKHMRGFAEELSKKGHEVILFDQRGTGNSTVPQMDSLTITFDLVLSDAAELIKKLHYKSVTVLGHSFGGILAMGFAAKFPGMVSKLVLCAPAGINLEFLDYFGDNIFQRLQNVPADSAKGAVTQQERENAFYNQLKRNAPAYFYNKENVPVFINMLTVAGSYNPDYNLLMWTDLFKINYNLSGKFRVFKKPTLIIQGRQDILGDETAIRINQAIGGSKLVFINRCGHVPWMDAPADFFSELEKILGHK